MLEFTVKTLYQDCVCVCFYFYECALLTRGNECMSDWITYFKKMMEPFRGFYFMILE